MKNRSLVLSFFLLLASIFSIVSLQFSLATPVFAADRHNVNYPEHPTQTNKPMPTPTPPIPQSPQENSGFFNFLASATSYALTLGNPVHFDNPQKGFARSEIPHFTLTIPTKTKQSV